MDRRQCLKLIAASGLLLPRARMMLPDPTTAKDPKMRNWDVLTLDPTGKTIPATYHSPSDPDGAVFMATNGDDRNDGRSEDRPVKTLNRAIDAAPNNATVCFRGGTYNDNYRNADGTYKILANKWLDFTSYLGEPVTFDGAGRLHHWMVCGSSIGVGTRSFRGFRLTGFAGGWEGTIGDIPLYLGDGQGAVYSVEDMLFDHNQGCGLNFQDPRGDLGDPRIVRCVFTDNGSNGITNTGNMSRTPGKLPSSQHENDLWISHCYFGRNNQANNQKPYEAGAKLHQNAKITMFGNIVEDTVGNYGHGLWTDVANRDARFLCNFVRRCGSDGLFDETGSPTAWFVSNVLVDCGLLENHANIRIASDSPQVMYNTSVVTGETIRGTKACYPIEIYDDVRNITTDGYSPDTKFVNMHSNMFAGGLGRYAFMLYMYSNQPPHTGGGTWPSDFWKSPGHWGRNAWWQMAAGKNYVRWNEKGVDKQYGKPADLQAAKGVGGQDILVTSDPFVDHIKWRLKTTSPAYTLGEPLPADIATALGYTPGQKFPMGYIDCPIPTWA